MAATAAPRKHSVLKLKVGTRTRLIVFDTQDFTVGRAQENDLAIDDAEISRRHAVFKRTREGCVVEDMGTSNGTCVNGQPATSAVLKQGDIVQIGGIEITFAETQRAPSTLGAGVEYASQLKNFGGPLGRKSGDGDATILGVMEAPAAAEDEDFEVRPAGEFDFDDLEPQSPAARARDLDAEMADFDVDSGDEFAFGNAQTAQPAKPVAPRAPAKAPAKPAPAPARAPAKPTAPAQPPARSAKDDQVWELEESSATAAPSGRMALTLEIDGLSGDLRRIVEGLIGKAIDLPAMRVRIKGRDLG
jgi:predicted component of type VI protein secretion system